MTKPFVEPRKGIIYTFYSFKGGVGRSMALANVAALLAKWGRSVLVVDWDLEAAGIERFFCQDNKAARQVRDSKPGVVDLVKAKAKGDTIDWHDCIHELSINGNPSTVKLITAGCIRHDYVGNLHDLNFAKLFAENDLGRYIEDLRNEWTSEFEFVLVDSRTGVTDIGGICTVHLADVLVLFFTATDSSTEGVLDILTRARKARDRLPVDRGHLIAVPVPSRYESLTEYEAASAWKQIFAEKFQAMYEDWLPREVGAKEAIELLKIPYIPYWSFGEGLPVKDGTSDPASLGYAYGILARLLASRLNWDEAIQGHVLPQRPAIQRRKPVIDWVRNHRSVATVGLQKANRLGFMEVYHYLLDSEIHKSQPELLAAAKQSMILKFEPPIGAVSDRVGTKPKPTNNGIVAEIRTTREAGLAYDYDYWALTKTGDFYALMSFSEDNPYRSEIFFDARIIRTAEAILHAANLYEYLKVEPNTLVKLAIRYGGLKGRTLAASLPEDRARIIENKNETEDTVRVSASFRLSSVKSDLPVLVEKLCEPLFILFDFYRFDHQIYSEVISNFIAGRSAAPIMRTP